MISHKRKCVFVHIPKCAGQSIESIFVHDAGLTWADRAPLLLRPNANECVGPPFLAHLTYQEYLRYWYISQELMDSYYVFTVTRNPYSRIESIYRYLGYSDAMTFKKFVMEVVPQEIRQGSGRFYFYRPQIDFIVDDDGKIAVDEVFRLERLAEILPVMNRMGIEVDALPHTNKTESKSFIKTLGRRYRLARRGHGSWSFAVDGGVRWDQEARGMINQLYRQDFERLGYEMIQ